MTYINLIANKMVSSSLYLIAVKAKHSALHNFFLAYVIDVMTTRLSEHLRWRLVRHNAGMYATL